MFSREQQGEHFLLCNRLPTQTCWWSFYNRWRTKWLLRAVGIKANLILPPGRHALEAVTRERRWSNLSLMCVCTPNFLSTQTLEGMINSETRLAVRQEDDTSAHLSCPINSECTGVLGHPVIYPFPSKLRPDRGQEIFYPHKQMPLLFVCVYVHDLNLALSFRTSYWARGYSSSYVLWNSQCNDL